MAIKLSDLNKDRRTCAVEWAGESFDVTYRPAFYTPEIEDKYFGTIDDERPSNALAELVSSGLIETWEILDEDGEPIEPTLEFARRLPTAVLTQIVKTVSEDMMSEKDARKNSGGRSRRKGSLA